MLEPLDAPARLPELPTDAEVLRLAQQVRTAAALGRCEHAWPMWQTIAKRDARYAAALYQGHVMAPCRVTHLRAER